MADVLLAFALGAAVLAIVLLYKSQTRQAARLAQLESEFVAEKIARLTQPATVTPPMAEEPSEPARRKRHLALYIGSGALAACTIVRDRLRSLWQGHRALTITAAATVATVSTAALAMTAYGDGTTEDRGHHPAASAPDRAEASASSAPDRSTRGSRRHSSRDTGTGNASSADSINLMTDGQQRPLSSEDTPVPSASGHPPPSERSSSGGNSTEAGTGRPSTPATEQPSSPGPGEPSTGTPEAPGSPEPTITPEPIKPVRPAVLTVGTPQLADADKRWCENVTVDIHNTGGTTATSGTLRFGTHIFDPFGGDWVTITQTRELPAPVPAGGHVEGRWTLCVNSWRVPKGWYIDTLDVKITQS
ncbi:hypothetical protein [Streptomyces sp. NPDC001750]|uniref:hypothetical protein n=1 Tax=Streptomyces sp. NPDC001750 TaxID=3364607 RepID=UPI0036B379A5